jgi:hypothetical protein
MPPRLHSDGHNDAVEGHVRPVPSSDATPSPLPFYLCPPSSRTPPLPVHDFLWRSMRGVAYRHRRCDACGVRRRRGDGMRCRYARPSRGHCGRLRPDRLRWCQAPRCSVAAQPSGSPLHPLFHDNPRKVPAPLRSVRAADPVAPRSLVRGLCGSRTLLKVSSFATPAYA